MTQDAPAVAEYKQNRHDHPVPQSLPVTGMDNDNFPAASTVHAGTLLVGLSTKMGFEERRLERSSSIGRITLTRIPDLEETSKVDKAKSRRVMPTCIGSRAEDRVLSYSRYVDDGIGLDNRVAPDVSMSSSDEDSREYILEEDVGDEDESDDSQPNSEASLSEEDIFELMGELVEAEMEAARIQESLEEESLFRVRTEVAAEFAETRTAEKVESAVEEEMSTYLEHCEYMLGQIEEKSALLQEKLEDAGVSLAHLFKLIERQISEESTTDAWKKRTLWVGHQPTEEVASVLSNASEELKVKYPTRSHRGKILDEGASGFLRRKFTADGEDVATECTSKPDSYDDDGWSKLEEYIDNDEDCERPAQLMGTKRWAAVYLASTPEQAAQLGLTLPGAHTVEEIGDTETEKRVIFKAALKNERERGLTEGQEKSIKKVREEDDLKKIRKMQRRSRQKYLKSKQARSVKGSQPNIFPNCRAVSGQLCPKRKSENHCDIVDLLSDDEDSGGWESAGRVQAASAFEPLRNGRVSQESIMVEVKNEYGQEDSGGRKQGSPSSSQGLDKKRPVEGRSGDAEKEANAKKLRTDHVHEERMSCLGCLHLESKQSPVQTGSKNHLVRKTVVIDSDGEREVEETLIKPLKSSGSPNDDFEKSVKEVVRNMKAGFVDHEDETSHSQDGVLVEQGFHKAEPFREQLHCRKRKVRIESDMRLKCTSCTRILKLYEMVRHPNPRLPVAVCRSCTKHYLSGPISKDEDGSDSECSWCGEGGRVVCCTRCDKVFCQLCIVRNFGAKELLRIVTDDFWLCFFCNETPLATLTVELEKAEYELDRLLEPYRQADLDNSANQEEALVRHPKKGKHRRNIRKMLSDDELEEKQRELLAQEKERQERLKRWQSVSSMPHQRFFASRVLSQPEAEKTQNEQEKVFTVNLPINAARDADEEAIFIAPSFAQILKPHQIQGVQFMWENCVESVKKVRIDPDGVGCILAHSMGLGKTLQVITFLHTVLTSDILKTALIVVPVNVLHNWRKEFDIWQESLSNPVPVYILDDIIRENTRRAQLLSRWRNGGGVMLIGYSVFRNLCIGKHVKDKATRDSLCASLQNPGPDLLVCDEAHMIKNVKADITQALKQVRSKRRVALTGSPLQNNLMEYYCMVDFVREGFLGPPSVFKNRFQNPIENGQHCDSTGEDVKIMKIRALALNKHLKGFVQRMDSSVLKDELPPKVVYVISVRLSKLQRRLYEQYLQTHGMMHEDEEACEKKPHRRLLFNAFHTLSKVWNHPSLLCLARQEKIRKQQEDCLDEFVYESDEEKFNESEGVGASKSSAGEGKCKASIDNRSFKKKGSDDLNELENALWWKDIMEGTSREDVNLSGKMVLLLELLSMSAARGDKTLVFSQSLGTLDLIEKFMETRLFLPSESTFWVQDKHWYRLDGSTTAGARMSLCEKFNNPDNTEVKCALISTRAGSLGINLPAANRVIIIDGSWNPVHDLQALFRAWRLGQKKPVFAYRFLACGTMEEKIYNRQVAKEGVAARVLDKNYPERIFNGDDLEFLFRLEADGDDYACRERERPVFVSDKLLPEQVYPSASGCFTSFGSTVQNKLSSFHVPDDSPPLDDVMGKLLLEHRSRWVVRYHEHEPLLLHQENEELSQEERQNAWETLVLESGGFQEPNPVRPNSLPSHSPKLPVTHSSASSSSRAVCSAKDHAARLSKFNVEVNGYILCVACHEFISWNSITGNK
ncbi:hypothetical protein R1flu_008588 [Riccia fluitans]|uniref:ATP-dependent helicase ATRX n=1 Tax=Riccia fluitans TaxID=41844 RepID=A0ABD1YC49_9MARC